MATTSGSSGQVIRSRSRTGAFRKHRSHRCMGGEAWLDTLRALASLYAGRMTCRQAITLVAASAAAFGGRPAPACAAVTQLDGTIIPRPSPAAEISVVTSRGFAASADTLSGLFQSFAGGVDRGLDPVADASTAPGNFDPTCGLRISIVLKGDGCQNALGWYNASQPPSAPATNMIYPVVPANLTGTFPNGIGCTDLDFCPMASRDTTQAPQHAWADPLPAFDPQIASSPNWRGGRVGFALIGNSGQCSQTKYSEVDLNVKSTAFGTPWITALVYPSMAAPGGCILPSKACRCQPPAGRPPAATVISTTTSTSSPRCRARAGPPTRDR